MWFIIDCNEQLSKPAEQSPNPNLVNPIQGKSAEENDTFNFSATCTTTRGVAARLSDIMSALIGDLSHLLPWNNNQSKVKTVTVSQYI